MSMQGEIGREQILRDRVCFVNMECHSGFYSKFCIFRKCGDHVQGKMKLCQIFSQKYGIILGRLHNCPRTMLSHFEIHRKTSSLA